MSTVLRRWLGPISRVGAFVYEKDVEMYRVKLLRFALDPKVVDPNPDFYMTMKGILF